MRTRLYLLTSSPSVKKAWIYESLNKIFMPLLSYKCRFLWFVVKVQLMRKDIQLYCTREDPKNWGLMIHKRQNTSWGWGWILLHFFCRGKESHWGIGSWDWNLKGNKSVYHALFPRAWTLFSGTVPPQCTLVLLYFLNYKILPGEPDPLLFLSLRQISPFIPGDYQTSSLPCAVFSFSVLFSVLHCTFSS